MWETKIQERLDGFVEEVKTDVERHLLAADGSDPGDLVWTFAVPSDGGTIVIGIDGNGRLVPQVYGMKTPNLDADMERLTRRVAFMVTKRVLPIILRLTPRPPFIAGDGPSDDKENR
jgi:hypothetical protein